MTKPRPVVAYVALAAAMLVAGGGAPARGGELTYHGSLGYSTGSYTLSEDTTTVVLFNGLTYEQGSFRFAVSLPVIYQDSPFVTWSGGTPIPSGRRFGSDTSGGDGSDGGGEMGMGRGPRGRLPVPDPDTLDFSDSGVGDPLLRADGTLHRGPRGSFGLFAAAKAPLAEDDSGFGTGEWDFGAGVSLLRALERGNLFLEVGRWSFGDLAELDLEDPWMVSVAFGPRSDGDRWSWLASLSAWSEALDGQDGPVVVGGTLIRNRPSGARTSLALTAGLTDTAPDWGLSLGWSVTP